MRKIHILSLSVLGILSLGLAFFVASCGGGGGGSNLANAVISSPFAVSTSTTTSLSVKGDRVLMATPTFESRSEEMERLLNETSNADNCKFVIDLARELPYANCYGPKVKYTGGGAPNPLPVGDTGFWNSTDTETGEACAAAQVTKLVNNQVNGAYFAQAMGATVKCYAQSTAALGLPTTVGDAKNFTADQLSDVGFTDANGNSVSLTGGSATVEGVANAAGDVGVKVTVSGGTVSYEGVNYPFTVRLWYVEESDGGFGGKANYILRDAARNEGNCNPPTGVSPSGSLVFSRADSSSNVKVMLNHADVCGTTYDIFSSRDDLFVCDEHDGGAEPGWGANWNYLNFEYNPSNLVGTYSYAWQAGRGDGNTRVFDAIISDSDSGVGYFGFGPDVADSTGACTARNSNLGKITGMICNWSGPGNDHNTINTNQYVQQQTLQKTAGKWTVASEKIKYVLSNDCTNVGGIGEPYSAVKLDGDAIGLLNWTLDSDVNASAPRQDLDSLTNYQSAFSIPAEPTF